MNCAVNIKKSRMPTSSRSTSPAWSSNTLTHRCGGTCSKGEPLARLVRPHETAALDATVKQKEVAYQDAQNKLAGLAGHFRALKAPTVQDVENARENVRRFEGLVKADAATRLELSQAQQQASAAENRLNQLAMQQATATMEAENRARALALEVKALRAKREAALAAQVVRSPVAGVVVEIRQKGATVHGLSVEVVILSHEQEDWPPPAGRVQQQGQQQKAFHLPQRKGCLRGVTCPMI